jgi:hypothetical protein
MAVSSSAQSVLRCARCGGQMCLGYEGEFTCLWCGEVRYPALQPVHGEEDLEAWRRRLRGKPGRPRRVPAPDRDVCA